MLSVKSDSMCYIMTSVKHRKPVRLVSRKRRLCNRNRTTESEVIIMNKVISWIRNHKEAAEDAAGLAAFAAVTVAFFFGSEVLLVVCGVAGVLAIGANVTA